MVPTGSGSVAEVVVEREHEARGGWTFEVSIRRAGQVTRHEVGLAWVDYEYWSHGSAAPEQVVRIALESLLDIAPDLPIPERFDLSTARAWARRHAGSNAPDAAGLDDRVRGRVDRRG